MTDDLKALVIGGGGVTGIAWATGMLHGLEREGLDLRAEDRLVGTSAGSAVAAQLTGRRSLEDLYDRQVSGAVAELPGGLGATGMLRVALPLVLHRDRARALRSLGRFAARTAGVRALARRAVIEQRLDGAEWNPDRDLRIAAVDIDAGVRTVLRAGGAASLVDAVEASCAVPGVWPVVTIAGRRYMDGGMFSPANVDLAAGASRVVVVAPLARAVRAATAPDRELAALGLPGRVIVPDEAAKAAMGSNPLDPTARRAAAEAGRVQAQREATAVAAVW